MKDLIISLESTCDLSKELIEKYDLKVVDMDFRIENELFSTKDSDVISSGLYKKMREGKKTGTSQINGEIYEEFFENLMKENKTILHIAFSSGLSSTYSSAKQTAEKLNQKYGKNIIYVVDSLCACSGHGMLAILARQHSAVAKDIDEEIKYVENLRHKLNHCFTVDSLKYLANGGRIKKTSAFVGTILNIKPVMRMDELGKLTVVNKVMSRKKSLIAIFNKFKETHDKDYPLVFISHADCLDDAKYMQELIRSQGVEPIITDLGPIIGCHSGPGTLAVYFIAKHR